MIVCELCCHFSPDRINPEAGLGRCITTPSHGAFYPAEKHLCRDFTPMKEAKTKHPIDPSIRDELALPTGRSEDGLERLLVPNLPQNRFSPLDRRQGGQRQRHEATFPENFT